MQRQTSRRAHTPQDQTLPACLTSHDRGLARPGGHSEGPNTRSHPELGRENPQRPWYCRSSGGRVGRRQARQAPQIPLSPSFGARNGRRFGLTVAGWSSPVARQAHNLKVVGSNPTPATNPAILSRKFNELWISRSSLKSVVNKINGLSDVGSNHTQPTHSCHPLNTHHLSAWKSATAARPWHRELLFMPLCRHCQALPRSSSRWKAAA